MPNEQQVYGLMRECLVGFRAHTMKLGDLLERMPELLKEVDRPDPAWKAEFIGYWWTLEQVHEEAIELGESGRMPSSTRDTVDEAIDGLDRVVERALSSAE